MISKAAEAYAGALFELAFEGGAESGGRRLQELLCLADVFNEREVLEFFLSPAVPPGGKAAALEEALNGAHPMLQSFFRLLLKKKRFGLMPEIRAACQRLLDERRGAMRGEILSARPLSPEEKRRAAQAAGRFFNKKLELEEKTGKNLIGGLCVRAGGWVISDSFSFHLKRFQEMGLERRG